MRSSILILLSIVISVFCCCSSRGQSVPRYVFHSLEVEYPASFEISGETLSQGDSLVSFVLKSKKNPSTRIEFGINVFPADFLSRVPEEELMGELVATVFDMKSRLFTSGGVIVENFGDVQVSEPGTRPEAYAFALVTDEGSSYYYILSSMIVGNYSINSVSISGDPAEMELLTSVMDNIKCN